MRYNPVPNHANWFQVTDAREILGLVGHNDDDMWTYAISLPVSDPEAFCFTSRAHAARNLRRHVGALQTLCRRRAVG